MKGRPDWVIDEETKRMFGQACAHGADEYILADREITAGYLEGKASLKGR
jgi:hypothetical protein